MSYRNFKFYIIYQITNLINDKIYIGCHKTNNIDDGYMGSGKRLNRAIKKYGIENFKKDILFYCNNSKEMYEKEFELVNEEFIKRLDIYNIKLGGRGGFDHLIGTVAVKDKNGNTLKVNKDDPRYLSGELVHQAKGKVTVKDKDGNIYQVSVNDPRYLSGEFVHQMKGTTTIKDKDGNIKRVSVNDPRYLSGEFVHQTKGKIMVKDKNGKCFRVYKNDPRYISGELEIYNPFKGRKHSEETKKKMSILMKEKAKGKGNSQYGTCWIYNVDLKQSIKIKKEELDSYLEQGWIKGRKISFNNGELFCK